MKAKVFCTAAGDQRLAYERFEAVPGSILEWQELKLPRFMTGLCFITVQYLFMLGSYHKVERIHQHAKCAGLSTTLYGTNIKLLAAAAAECAGALAGRFMYTSLPRRAHLNVQ